MASEDRQPSLQRAPPTGGLQPQCCFCSTAIADGGVDPCELVLVTGFGRPDSDRRTQALYCHAECLRGSIDPRIPLDIDPD